MDAALTRREMKGIKSDRDVGRRVAPVVCLGKVGIILLNCRISYLRKNTLSTVASFKFKIGEIQPPLPHHAQSVIVPYGSCKNLVTSYVPVLSVPFRLL